MHQFTLSAGKLNFSVHVNNNNNNDDDDDNNNNNNNNNNNTLDGDHPAEKHRGASSTSQG